MINIQQNDDEDSYMKNRGHHTATKKYDPSSNHRLESRDDELAGEDFQAVATDHLYKLNQQQWIKIKNWLIKAGKGFAIFLAIALFIFYVGSREFKFGTEYDCSTLNFWTYSPKKSTYITSTGFKVQTTAYPKLSLVSHAADPSPSYHYPQLVSYIRDNPVRSSVYIQSGTIYSILLTAASTPESVSIIIPNDFKEKYLLKTCFVVNNMKDRLVFEEPKDSISNMQNADLVLSVSSDFLSRYPSKTIVFQVDHQSINPNRKAISKLSQTVACGSIKILANDDQVLSSGLYIANYKQSTLQAKNYPSVPAYAPRNAYQSSKYVRNILQKTTVPDFECKNDLITNWNQNANSQAYQTIGYFRIQKIPYPQLVLVSKNTDPSPTYHYPQLLSYLKENPVKSYIYVQSGSIYSILLMGASTSENVTIIVGNDFKEKYLLKTCFVVNNIKNKLVFEEAKDTISNIQNADLVVSISCDFVSKYPSKTTIFYVEHESLSPNRKNIVKLVQKEACGALRVKPEESQVLPAGLYVSPAQC